MYKPLICHGRRKRFSRFGSPARFLLLVLSAFISLFFLASCSRAGSGRVETITVSGSTTILPIAEQAAEQFSAQHEGVRVLVSGMGSSAGIEAVGVTGTADIGTSSREAKGVEVDLDIKWIPIANDGIAVIVHPSNPINGLSTAQIRDIFAGKISNWRELGGEDLPVTLINRDESSGTRDAFEAAIMNGVPFDVNAVVLPGTGQVREVVTRATGAIGYISVGFVEPRFVNTRVKALTVDTIEPTEDNIAAGIYPLSRRLYFILPSTKVNLLAEEYTDYVLSPDVQEGAVREAGFLPISLLDATDTGRGDAQ